MGFNPTFQLCLFIVGESGKEGSFSGDEFVSGAAGFERVTGF
jgi:hypothetical protein